MKYEFLPSKRVKELLKKIEENWGAYPEILKENALLQNVHDKIYLVTRDIEKVPFKEFNINSMGLYIAEWKRDELRLSIEGSQLIGESATKNIVELNKEELREWLTGNDLDKEATGWVIMKHGKDYVGTGKAKEGRILNFVPKARRIADMH